MYHPIYIDIQVVSVGAPSVLRTYMILYRIRLRRKRLGACAAHTGSRVHTCSNMNDCVADGRVLLIFFFYLQMGERAMVHPLASVAARLRRKWFSMHLLFSTFWAFK